MTHLKPVVLAILDGWGIAPSGEGNAISLAKTPNMSKFWSAFVHTQLIAHGESVGLPKREPGNTETGHLNIGAGSIIYQDLPRINMSIADGSFFQNQQLQAAAAHAKKFNSDVHLLGLVGGGGVHSDLSHFYALIRFLHEQNINNVYIHVFTDGRDSPPSSAITYINQLESVLNQEKTGKIASVMGRYYAMDRDFRWDRTAKAYECLTHGTGKSAESVQQAVSNAYSQNLTDEFIEPTIITKEKNIPLALIKSNDVAIFVNFRIDRPRQLTKAFVLDDFENTANTVGWDPFATKYQKKHVAENESSSRPKPFTRGSKIDNLFFITMTEYEKNLPVQIAFPPQAVDNPVARVISEHGLRQIHMSESEKERFVTYYFNGLRDAPFTSEEHLIVPSPKVPTYDKKPEMSARELTTQVIDKITSQAYDFIVVNFANPDMVGHTGNIPAAIKACETVDECIGKIADTVLAIGGALFVTADHGNVEEMINLTTGLSDTEHNANPVPAIIVSKETQTASQVPQGILADVAPTLLHLLQIPIPITMTGRNLLGNIH